MAEIARPDAASKPADRLTGQLYHLPEIIGRLGISIANAQKALNADYLTNVKLLLEMIDHVVGTDGSVAGDARLQAIHALLKSLAPSRYQFTETTIDFSADLSETFNLAVGAGLGIGFGAIMVNAAFSLGFGYDYRAAARIKSSLHAIPADPAMVGTFLAQADKITSDKLNMPPRSDVDVANTNQVTDIYNALTNQNRPQLPLSPVETARQAAEKATKHALAAESLRDKANAEPDANKRKALKDEAKTYQDAAEEQRKVAESALKDNLSKEEKLEIGKSITTAKDAAERAKNAVEAIKN